MLSKGLLKAGALTAVAAHAAPYGLSLAAYSPRFAGLMQRRLPALYGLGLPGHVAMTFDDGPHPEGTPRVLEALEAVGWKATFFMVGDKAERHPQIARQVVDGGHEIGLHGYSHRSYMRLALPGALKETARGRTAVEQACGRELRWFRPPYGTLSGPAYASFAVHGLRPVLWSAWGKDWGARTNGKKVAAMVMKGTVDGGTVLLHDSDSTSSPGNFDATVEAIAILAARFAEVGLKVGTLEEHFALTSLRK